MTSLTRDVLKWVQEFQMHSYDTGMGPAAKRNNWEQLQKACGKVGIILTRELVEDVMRSKAEAGAIALSLVHHHVMKSGSSPLVMVQPNSTPQQNPSRVKQPPSKGLKTKLEPLNQQQQPQESLIEQPQTESIRYPDQSATLKSVSGAGGIVMNNLKAASQFLLGINASAIENPNESKVYSLTSVGGTTTEAASLDEHLGKVAVLKVLCGLFGITDQQVSFSRSCFATLLCREKLIGKFDAISSEDIDLLPKLLFEVLIPCVINFASDTKVLHMATAISCYFASLLQNISSKEASNRITQIKEVSLLLSKITSSPEKIPFVARILNAFVGPDTPDSEKVRAFLFIKNAVYSALASRNVSVSGSNTGSFVGAVTHASTFTDTGNPFISLLCAVQLESSSKKAQDSKQPTSFEEMDHVKPSQHITLLLSELCAALHLLAHLASQPNPKHFESSEDIQHDKPVRFKTGAVGVLPDGVRDIIGQEKGSCVQNAAGCVLKAVSGDVLRSSLILLSPALENHPPLCTPFIPVIDESSWTTSSTDLLTASAAQCVSGQDQGLVIYWDLPFLSKQVLPRVVDTWFPFGIAMGIIRLMQTSKHDLMPREYLQILLAVSVSISISPEVYIPSRNRKDIVAASSLPSVENLAKDPWAHVYMTLSDAINASLIQQETSQYGVNIIESFLRTRGALIAPNLKGILASIVYLHVAGHRRPRERLLRLVKRWASFQGEYGWNTSRSSLDSRENENDKTGKTEKHCLVEVSTENQAAVQAAMSDVLRNFTSGTGGVSHSLS
ncbi:hypothetical protein BCR33DRAFT_715505 [Rhizoclosmatium globosum]|uniref:CH-like domain-containing protein n=1 Tax=Rhizoclosmatium globosum TaxID=329046 RepID=A0A1Y2CH87_9FUNG|nr:hypothetical protein BCR33DRAFT_715505 [Rhizoclosmatium globosum]|eukprot:ORY46413.1 hypothetical protein BCR33DRAFT_715505 [Rhizoclosmatium globosum]